MKTSFYITLFSIARCFASCGGGGGGGGNSCALDNLACPASEFCQFEAGECGDAGAPGSCSALASSCGGEVAPVCTCDGLTFSNECLAKAGGHSVRASGECA